MEKLKGKDNVAFIIFTIIMCIIQLNIFLQRSEAYKDFITKDDYKYDIGKLNQKLDSILDKLESKEDRRK